MLAFCSSALFAVVLGIVGAVAPAASAATFEPIVPKYDAVMALLIDGEIFAGDSSRLVAAVDAATARYTDHRMRAVALNSLGGSVGEALEMANVIRDRGLVTVVPEGGQCVSACVLLFAAGSRKIASTGSSIGVHGVSNLEGEQGKAELATTTRLAKIYAQLGVPASVIGRMVVTPPEHVEWLTRAEIEMFPWGAVMPHLKLADAPIALSGLDVQLRRFEPPRTAPAYQKAGPALPTPAPPSETFSAAPSHSAELIRRATEYSTGYVYGDSIGAAADCSRGMGRWHSGCLAGSYEREKFDPPEGCLARANRSPDPSLAEFNREMCRNPDGTERTAVHDKRTVATHVQQYLQHYDYAYMHKSGEGSCGNGAEPSNDGCRAGAMAWSRTETSAPAPSPTPAQLRLNADPKADAAGRWLDALKDCLKAGGTLHTCVR